MQNKDNLSEYFNRRAELAMKRSNQPFYYEVSKRYENKSKHKGSVPITKVELCKDIFVVNDP